MLKYTVTVSNNGESHNIFFAVAKAKKLLREKGEVELAGKMAKDISNLMRLQDITYEDIVKKIGEYGVNVKLV